MSDEIIEEGAIVMLRSGGPIMTVDRIYTSSDTQSAKCMWFEPHEQFGWAQREKWFKVAALTIVDIEDD